MPPVDADDTTVSSAIAPWDPAETDPGVDTASGDRITQQTSSVSLREYEVAPGMKLGEYEVQQRLGQGGMGVVYAAVHPLIGKRAAIKILKKELCADPTSLERFVDEARVVNQIGHPNIVDVFAFGEMPDGRSYFVMELLEGETLRARVARSRLTLDEVRGIIKPLARALQAAHDKGVIHRDLKPDNVFLVDLPDEPPRAKLLDFGIAKLARDDRRVEKTATGALVGTPQYIAPEQAKGYLVDPRADIYALGAMLFELLTGRPPFIADNAMEMVAKHLMEAPVSPSSLVRGISPELDDLVLRMLAKTPDGRPTLGEVIAVIERSRISAATVPFDRPTPPPTKSDPVQAVTTPRDTIAVVDSRARPRWVLPAILGVPVVAVLAFVLVRALASHDPPPAAATPPAVSPPTVSLPTVSSPPAPHVVAPSVAPSLAPAPTPHVAAPRAAAPSVTPTPAKKGPPKKDPPKKLAPKKDPQKDPQRDFTIPDGDGLAEPFSRE